MYSTNAKPRGRPVSRSTGSTTCDGGATAPKYVRSSASVVAYDRFPTNRRTANQHSSNGSEISRVDKAGQEGAKVRRRKHAGSRSSGKTLPEVSQHGKSHIVRPMELA